MKAKRPEGWVGGGWGPSAGRGWKYWRSAHGGSRPPPAQALLLEVNSSLQSTLTPDTQSSGAYLCASRCLRETRGGADWMGIGGELGMLCCTALDAGGRQRKKQRRIPAV